MNSYDDLNLHQMNDEEAVELCSRLRADILETVSTTGGHLASGLGAVELTVALHRVFDLEKDRLVFDVGHQCYSHKLLSGRAGQFNTLRTFGGISGYPKPEESPCDAFIAGHASNSVSVALGMARARTICHENYSVIALIGDGALTGGLAYEGLSNAGQSGEPLLVILNDNGMSITESVGGIAQHLARQRLKAQYLTFKKGYRKIYGATKLGRRLYRFNHKVKTAIKDAILPCSMFENMGFTYLGPVDGHNVKQLTQLLRYAKELNEPVLLHVRTIKGKGYAPAETAPDKFHGVGPFDLKTGESKKAAAMDYSAVFGETLCALAEKEPRLCAITAAMQSGTGLTEFAKQFPTRYFDVGIAEGHGVSMAAGMAKQGAVPVFAVYSSFLQRGYDMLVHDVALQKLHVVLGVDRAGLVGEDGDTHHGLFDVAYLSSVPNMKIFAPAGFDELRDMLTWAIEKEDGPVAVRYPRGKEGNYRGRFCGQKTVVMQEGTDITLVTYGATFDAVMEAVSKLLKDGFQPEVIKLNELAQGDWTPIFDSVRKTKRLLIAEECISQGSVGQKITSQLAIQGIPTQNIALSNIGDRFIPHGSVEKLRALCGLDAESIYRKAREVLGRHE